MSDLNKYCCLECKKRNTCPSQGLGDCAAFVKGDPEPKTDKCRYLKGDVILKKVLSVFDKIIEEDSYGNGCTMEDIGLVLIDSGWRERSKVEKLLEEEFNK